MESGKLQHKSVLLEAALQYLNLQPNGIYIDATFGRGGHSRSILKALGEHGKLLAFDRDPDAMKVANALERDDERFSFVQQNGGFSLALKIGNLDLFSRMENFSSAGRSGVALPG